MIKKEIYPKTRRVSVMGDKIVITEIPYDVVKANMIRKMNDQITSREVDGVRAIRDESDKSGLRIVIDIRKDVNPDYIVNFLLKTTELQTSYNYNMVAISESTPGPIGVNMATYIGYNLHGISGAIITSIGEILPSLICILIIAKFLKSFQQKTIVQSVFSVLRPATTGLIFVAAVQIFLIALVNVPSDISVFKEVSGWTNLFNWKSLYFYVIAVFMLFKVKLHPVVLLVFGALFGILFL